MGNITCIVPTKDIKELHRELNNHPSPELQLPVASYSGNITPSADTIFVFGSNPEGRHGAGAAKVAREQFGAVYGVGEGLTGNAYALPTKDLRVKKNRSLRSIPPEQIIESIRKLYETARQNPDKQFKVAYRNTDRASLNGYTGLEMIDMFLKAGSIPTNIVFSKEWVDTGRFNLSRNNTISNYLHITGPDRGFLTEEGERLLGKSFYKEKFNEGTTEVRLYNGVKGTYIRIYFTSPITGNSVSAIYDGNPKRLWSLYNASDDNVTDITSDSYWNAIEKIVPKSLRDFIESGEYDRSQNIAAETDSETLIVKRTVLEDYLEREYGLLIQGRSLDFNTEQINKALERYPEQKSTTDMLDSALQEEITVEQILGWLREFCVSKRIPQKLWDRYQEEAFDYVRQRAQGIMPEVQPFNDIETAGLILQDIVDYFRSVVRESKNFKKDHIYYVTGSDGKERPADISVTAYGNRNFRTFSADAYRREQRNFTDTPAMAIGRTFDAIARDFFNNDLKEDYPNMDAARLESIRKGLERVRNFLDSKFPEGYRVMATPFPIAAQLTDYKGEQFSVAGEMDLLVIDSRGNLYIYDMKTTSKGPHGTASVSDIIESNNQLGGQYSNQLSLYARILETAFPEREVRGKGLIVADTVYPSGRIGEAYNIEENDQLSIDGVPVQNLPASDYSIYVRLINQNYVPVSVQSSSSVDMLEFEALSPEEKAALEDSPLGGIVASQGALQDVLDSAEAETMTDEATLQDVEGAIPEILPSAKYKLGVKLVKSLVKMTEFLRTDDDFRAELFPEYEENYFIGKETREIITPATLPVLLDYLKRTYFLNPETNIDESSPIHVKAAQKWMAEHFNELLTAAPSRMVSDLGLSPMFSSEDSAEEGPQTLSQEEESEREEWSWDDREIPVETKMSEVLKQTLATLYKVEYTERVDEDGNVTWEAGDYMFDEFGVVEFLERGEVVLGLLDGLHTARTGEEMIARLRDPKLVSRYTWYPQIAQLLEDNPEIQSEFFKIFRTNRTNYVSTYIEETTDYEGDKEVQKKKAGKSNLVEKQQKVKIVRTFQKNVLDGKSQVFKLADSSGLGYVTTDMDATDRLMRKLESVSAAGGRRGLRRNLRTIAEVLEEMGFDDYLPALSSLENRRITDLVGTIRDFLRSANANKGTYIPWNESALKREVNGRKYDVFQELVNFLRPYIPVDSGSSTVYSNGKNYQVYTAPSYLGDLFEGLSDPYFDDEGSGFDNHVRGFLESRYARSRQTCFNPQASVDLFGTRPLVFVSSWVQKLHKNPSKARSVRHFIETSGLDRQYKEMNLYSYPLAAIAQYWLAGKTGDRVEGRNAAFYIPTISDKNSSEYVVFEKHSFMGADPAAAKRQIAEEASSMILYEIIRMKDVFRSDIDGTPKIDVYSSRIPKSITDKLREGKSLTKSDIVEKGELKPFMRSGGAAFNFFPGLNREFVENTPFAQLILKYISGKADFDVVMEDGVTSTMKQYAEEAFIRFMEEDFANSFLPMMESVGVMERTDILSPDLTGYTDLRDAMEEFYWNSTLASANIFAMTIIDPAFYNGAVQVQKRFAQVHAMTDRVDVTTRFTDRDGNTRRLSDGQHRFIIMDDSTLASDSTDIISRFYDRKISLTSDPKRKTYLQAMKETALRNLRDIKFTDGQAITSVDGYFKKMGMLGVLTPSFKEAYYRIIDGDFTNDDLRQVYSVIKPFVFSWENISYDESSPFYVPLQIKDSEYVLMMLPAMVDNLKRNGVLGEDNLLAQLFDFMHSSAYDNDEWNGRGVDTVVFMSAVKGGASNVVSQEKLKEILSSDNKDELWDYVHLHDFYDWGKQQETPDHLQDHEQSMPSQTRVLIPAKIDRNSPVRYRGEKVRAGEVIDRYNSAIADDMQQGVEKVKRQFSMEGSRLQKNRSMSDFQKANLLKDSRSTGEEYKAVSLRNGEFNVPLGDPVNMEKYVSNTLAAVKKAVNKELIPGGPTVQVSPFGYNMPKVVFNQSGELEYFEVYVTFPSSVLERKMTPVPSDKVWKKLTPAEQRDARLGLPLSVRRGLELKLITEDDLKAIASRIPVEEKYSIWPMRITAFLPRVMGEYAVIPPEIVVLSGGDFDIDKIYLELKYTKSKGDEMTDRQKLKNDIVDMQFSLLTSEDAAISLFTPQDISPLKQIAEKVNPSYKNVPYAMTQPQGQFYFQNQNMIGKDMVAISASTNAAHAMGTMTQVGVVMPDIRFNGVSLQSLGEIGYTRLDPVESPFDGSTVGRTSGMFVGASADNAKDPVDAAVGYQKKTANFYTGLLRLGIPAETVSLLLNQPIVQKVVKDAELSDSSFNTALTAQVEATAVDLGIADVYSVAEGMDLTDSWLSEQLENPDKGSQDKILFSLYALKDVMDVIYSISDLYKLNSTQNAVGPNPWKTLRNMVKLNEINRDMKDKDNPMARLSPDAVVSINDNIPFVPVLKSVYDELVPALMGEYFPVFSNAFTGLLQFMSSRGFSIGRMSDKEMRGLFKEFTVYYGTGNFEGQNLIDGSLENRQRLFYGLPIGIIKKRDKLKRFPIMSSLEFKSKASKKVALPALNIDTSIMSPMEKDMLTSSWWGLMNPQSMIYSQTKSMATDLFEYNIFRSGFFFSPVGFITLAPNIVKNSYREGAYRKLSDASYWKDGLSSVDYFNFLQQYARNHPYGKYVLKCSKGEIVETDFGVQVDTEIKAVPSTTVLLKVGNQLYVRLAEDSSIFVPTTRLGFDAQGFEYNRLEAGDKIKSARSVELYKKVTQNYQEYLAEQQTTAENQDEEYIEEHEDNSVSEDIELSSPEVREAETLHRMGSISFAEDSSLEETIDAVLSSTEVRQWLDTLPGEVTQELYDDNMDFVRDSLYRLAEEKMDGDRFRKVKDRVKETLKRYC